MNNSIKACLLTMGIAAAFVTADTNAAVVAYGSAASAPARCQAFTPGPSNTIRNRVVGSENIGSAIAVACAFEVGTSAASTNALAIDMYFSNNSAAAITVPCTLLTGWQGAAGAVLVNKSASVAANAGNGTVAQAEILFDSDDTPSTTDVDLGFPIVGVNCTLPTSGVINDTYVFWGDENGV